MTQVVCPIVGAFFRPPAKTVLKLLDIGHELILIPEPDNQYDPDAIKVTVKLDSINIPEEDAEAIADELVRFGATWEDLRKDEWGEIQIDPIFHLGYVPRSGGKTARIDSEPSIGNKEVLALLHKQNGWKITLTYSPAGQALVKISDETE